MVPPTFLDGVLGSSLGLCCSVDAREAARRGECWDPEVSRRIEEQQLRFGVPSSRRTLPVMLGRDVPAPPPKNVNAAPLDSGVGFTSPTFSDRSTATSSSRQRLSPSASDAGPLSPAASERGGDRAWSSSSSARPPGSPTQAVSEWAHGDGVRRELHWLGDRRQAWGVSTWSGGQRYEGQFRNATPHGRGMLQEPDGSSYSGQFVAGEKDGYGVYIHHDGTVYKGNWRDGAKSGIGEERWPCGSAYEGQFQRGLKHGRGIFLDASTKYVGEFHDDLMHGQGNYEAADGRKYVGQFFKGQMHGHGRIHFPSGAAYEGWYERGLRNGRGVSCETDGSIYQGQWLRGQKHGQGMAVDTNDARVVEQWCHGELLACNV